MNLEYFTDYMAALRRTEQKCFASLQRKKASSFSTVIYCLAGFPILTAMIVLLALAKATKIIVMGIAMIIFDTILLVLLAIITLFFGGRTLLRVVAEILFNEGTD